VVKSLLSKKTATARYNSHQPEQHEPAAVSTTTSTPPAKEEGAAAVPSDPSLSV
jgi:hypothetical protein